MKILLTLIASLFVLGGCTSITILNGNGVVTIHREFGFVSLTASPETDAIVAEMASFGYLASPIGVSVGYGNHSVALLPETCHVVLWVENKSVLKEFKSLIGNDKSICPVVVDNE